ncbi:MAG: hypothetical protein IJ597_01560 [Synergistaceae bacterium]|nr:hypothetical protein [Synergistaceae bacterium]
MYKKILYVALLVFVISGIDDAFCAEKAILVNQPAYHSMNFYVFKPDKLPNEFFATYDGYLVYKNAKGIWHYASVEKSGIEKTGYVVGSVLPSIVKLKPYNTKISSVAPILAKDTNAPILITVKPYGERISSNENISMQIDSPETLEIDVTPITARNFRKNDSQKTQKILYTPPVARAVINEPVYSYVANNSSWMQDARFMAISKWKSSVDRIGVLENPKTPIAWKGEYPEVIYVWNGMEWRQIIPQKRNLSVMNTIRREIYNLTVNANKLNYLKWTDDDTNILLQYAAAWNYQWLGTIFINKEY